MKKIGTLILSIAIAATMIAGCGNKLTTSDTAPSSSETAATTEATTEAAKPQSFDDIYGPQLKAYMDREYYFDGKKISKQEANFYFINSFRDLSSYAAMGYYPKTADGHINLSAECNGDDYKTYGEYFIMYSEKTLQSTCILVSRAEQSGVTLDEDMKKSIDDMMEDIRTNSAPQYGKTVDEYLQMNYGPGMDEASFRTIVERYYLADAYSNVYCNNYQFTDAEKYVPRIRYALFMARETDSQTQKDSALSAATAMLNNCKTIDDISPLAAIAQQSGIVADQGDIDVPKGQMVPKFEEWAYGEGRTEGEMEIIYAPEYGYFVVGYLGLTEQSEDVLKQIALRELSDGILKEIDTNTHNFRSDSKTTISNRTSEIILVVLITLGCVVVLGVIIYVINYMIKNSKNGKSSDKSKKSGSSKKTESSSKSKSEKTSKKEE